MDRKCHKSRGIPLTQTFVLPLPHVGPEAALGHSQYLVKGRKQEMEQKPPKSNVYSFNAHSLHWDLHMYEGPGRVRNLDRALKDSDNKVSRGGWRMNGPRKTTLDLSSPCILVAFRWPPAPFLGTTALNPLGRSVLFGDPMRSGSSLCSQSCLLVSAQLLPRAVTVPLCGYDANRMSVFFTKGLNTARAQHTL